MLAGTNSATLIGIAALPVTVEANDGERGDPKLVLVGLPDSAVRESVDRVQSSLSNSGFSLPRTHTTINLAPGDLRKEGSAFDLPIALSILASTGQMDGSVLGNFLIAGELGLSGKTRKVKGGLSMAILAQKMNLSGILLPLESAKEASQIDGLPVYPVNSLSDAVGFFNNQDTLKCLDPVKGSMDKIFNLLGDFSEIKGQLNLKPSR